MELSTIRNVIFVIAGIAALLLFTPYEAYLEGFLAVGIVTAAVVGSLMHPRREVFYVRTAVRLTDPDRNQVIERDYLAVRVELARLWLWYVPTSLAVVILVFFAVGGHTNFSFLNWIFSSRYVYPGFLLVQLGQYPPLLVLLILSAWIDERRVMRDAEACSATTFTISRAHVGWVGRVGYQFRGERGEYWGGDCLYYGFRHNRGLASVVFHNVRKPELNKIAMGFIFHRFIVLGHGVTDLDKETEAAHAALVESLPVS